MQPTMITERLELIPTTLALCEAEAQGREAIERVLGVRAPASWPPAVYQSDDVQRIRRQLERDRGNRMWTLHYVVQRQALANGVRELLGVAGYAGPPSAAGVIEIGYAIAEEHQRQGYAIEAVNALILVAFQNPGIVSITATTYATLGPSIGVLRKAGFSRLSSDPGTGLLRYERRRDTPDGPVQAAP
jgi:[ribosomal protein S5]-alanine N-acetyltransferase